VLLSAKEGVLEASLSNAEKSGLQAMEILRTGV